MPNLIKRFYLIPQNLINWGGVNVLEVELYGEHALGISEAVYIREASSPKEQNAIREMDDNGNYLAALRDLKPAHIEGELFCDRPEAAGKYGEIELLARIRNVV